MVKNEWKWKWRHPYISIARGMNHLLMFVRHRIVFSLEQPSLLHVLSSSMLVTPYLCQSGQQWQHHQSSKIVSSDKDIHLLLGAAREKVGDLPLNMCSIFKAIAVTIFRSVSWAIICSLPQGHQNKWVPRLLMVWPH